MTRGGQCFVAGTLVVTNEKGSSTALAFAGGAFVVTVGAMYGDRLPLLRNRDKHRKRQRTHRPPTGFPMIGGTGLFWEPKADHVRTQQEL